MSKNFMQINHFIFICVRFSALFFLIINISSCNSSLHQQKITIAGSTTILPISEDWAGLFQKKTGIIVNVQGGGSTNGINLIKAGKVDIGASSRNLSEEEEIDLRKIEIGKDALAIVVHPSNSIAAINTDQLKKIFSGQIKNWKELGGSNRPIQVLNRESGSGTRSTFEELIMCFSKDKNHPKCEKMELSSIVLNSNAEVKRSVMAIPDSIGYISFGFLDNNVKALVLNGISPLEDEVRAGKYPISRGLYYLLPAHKQSPETVNEFLAFIKTPEGLKVLANEGFLAVKEK
jgi:phosphate transport system substrate-binding protein